MKLNEDISRLEELWADRATGDLDAEGLRELRASVRRMGVDDAVTAPELAMASLHVAMLADTGIEEMPRGVMDRIMADIPEAAPRRGIVGRILPWAAIAAAVTLAVVSWLPREDGRARFDSATVDRTPDRVAVTWGDWDSPEIAGVRGEVVWSESLQTGYMRFSGLPKNDTDRERYQLWIIDDRGMGQRISGAIFDSTGGETIVPIEPGIRVQNAAAFAVTIEKPTGVWVSDMTRRVSIATVGKK